MEQRVTTLWKVKMPKKVLLKPRVVIQLRRTLVKIKWSLSNKIKASKTRDCPPSAVSKKGSNRRQLKRLQSLPRDSRRFAT